MTQKGVEAELKRFLEEEADHMDCLQTGGMSNPISTAHLSKSAKSLKKEVNQDFFSSDNVIIPKK